MSAKTHGQRIVILVIVAAFVLSSLGLSGIVIWDLLTKKNQDSSSQDLQKQLDEMQKNQNKLAGKPLQDFKPVNSVKNLKIIDSKAGTGKTATKTSIVQAHYTGAFADTGIIFESSRDNGAAAIFPLPNVIKGWQEGVAGMREGGIRRLIIPANLAYGKDGRPPTVGPNQALVFDIELISIQ